jgi:hypothetical protein
MSIESASVSTSVSASNRPMTLTQLGLDDVTFPESFTPRYLTLDPSGCWYVFDTKPTFEHDEWTVTNGKWHEIAGDQIDRNYSPAFARGLSPGEAIFEIA